MNATTEYQYGTGTGSLADVTNGTVVVVQGTSTGDNALTALTRSGQAGPGGRHGQGEDRGHDHDHEARRLDRHRPR